MLFWDGHLSSFTDSGIAKAGEAWRKASLKALSQIGGVGNLRSRHQTMACLYPREVKNKNEKRIFETKQST